jgi:hypothetical protein
VGLARFDDPLRGYRVLYVAEERVAAFLESLQDLRPNLGFLARLQRQPDPTLQESGRIDDEWNTRRRVGRLRLGTAQRWLNLQSVETAEVLRREFAELLLDLGMRDFDVSIAGTKERRLTQPISRWAHERGFQGIKYTSRFGHDFTCWAIFEGAAFTADGDPEIIPANDLDLIRAARIFQLRLPDE